VLRADTASRAAARRVAVLSQAGLGSHDLLPRALNRLDVVHAAAIPLRAEPTAIRCGEMVE
jgi:hypothetical protein